MAAVAIVSLSGLVMDQVILIATTIVVSLQTVGVALMVAMLITPAATAYLVSRRLPVMMILAACLASLSGIIGLYVSYYAGVASGAASVITSTLIFALTWGLNSLKNARIFKRRST